MPHQNLYLIYRYNFLNRSSASLISQNLYLIYRYVFLNGIAEFLSQNNFWLEVLAILAQEFWISAQELAVLVQEFGLLAQEIWVLVQEIWVLVQEFGLLAQDFRQTAQELRPPIHVNTHINNTFCIIRQGSASGHQFFWHLILQNSSFIPKLFRNFALR